MPNKSPKYKQRLSALYEHPEKAQNKRANILRAIKGTAAPEGTGNQTALNRMIALSPAEPTNNSQLKFALGSTPNGRDFLSTYIASNKRPLKNPSFTNEDLSKKYNPDEAVRNWYVDYINSPKYKERLRKQGYTNANQVVKDRRDRIQGAKIAPVAEDRDGSFYDSGTDNTLYMDNRQVKKLKTTRDDVLAHELGHVNNSSVNSVLVKPDYNVIETPSNTSLSANEEEYIATRNKDVGFLGVLNAQGGNKRDKRTLSNILSNVDHDMSPYESKSDLDAFRYNLQQEGIYNSGTQDFTPELLEKAKKNKNIKKLFTTQRLFKHFSDDDIVNLMNEIAMNKVTKSNFT